MKHLGGLGRPGAVVRGLGWKAGAVLFGWLGLFLATGFGEAPLAHGKAAAEPPRVRAARRFLARRGGAAGLKKRILRFAQDDKTREDDRNREGRAGEDDKAQTAPARGILPDASGGAVWTAAGPVGVSSLTYGLVTGRISAIALDPSDTSGNTVFVGTTGGGLWKSQNAAANTASSVQFLPLTDNLSVLSGAAQAGISVGAVTVQPGGTGVVLAGLGDPNDGLDSYYGAGLLRSTDGGQTWSLISKSVDFESGLGTQDYKFVGEGFAGFAWSTANVQIVVAAVSQAYEGTLVNAGENGASYEGLYWSNDAGASWHLARITDPSGVDVQGPLDGFALPDGNAATAVVWNPVRQVFVAAVRFHGYYQSTDGVSWTRLANQPGSGLTTANCPTEPGSTGVAGCPIFRGALAVNPQTGDTFAWTVDEFNQDQGIWQDACGISGFGSGASCTNPSITFGTQLGTTALETADANGPATIENGDYNLTLAAVPGAPGAGQDTLLFAGDNDLWKCSLANSCTWRNTTNATTCMSAQVAEYEHALAWDAGNPLLMYAGTDGGLWRSTDQVGETGAVCAASDASHWQNLNGALGSLAEVESLGQSSTTAATMLAGLGASGSAGIVNAPAKAGNWNEVLGGEGGPVAVTPSTAQNSWYVNNGAGVSILSCAATVGTLCTAAGFGSTPAIGEAQVGDDGLTMPYPAEFRVDALDPTQLLVGTCRVWRGAATGSGWAAGNAISPILDGTGGSVCNGNALIRSMGALATGNGGEAIYVGMAGATDGGGVVPGHLFAATISSGGTVSSWTDLAESPVGNSSLAFNSQGEDVSSIYVDPHDTTGQTVYATISGFSSPAAPEQQIFRSTNGGALWNAIESNLPNAPVNAVVVDAQDPNTVYVGTDVGVYVTRTVGSCGVAGGSSACWAPYGTGLPLAPVTTLTATPAGAANQVLTAGTYGRGIWQIPTVTAGGAITTATVSPASLTFAATTVGAAAAAQTVTLKNTGSVALNVTSLAITGNAAGDFSETDTCAGRTVTSNGSCSVTVSFAPSQTGGRTASLAIEANVTGGQLLVPLSGAGQAAGSITLNPASLSFATQQTGTTSAAQSIGVQNVGGSTVSITSIVVSAPFKLASRSCGSSLTASTACAVTVTFAPTQAGGATGTMTVTDSVGTQTAQLSGTGILAPTDTLSTTSLSFPATVEGQTSAPMTVTVTNAGGLPLMNIGTSVTNIQGSTDFQAVSNCGSQLAGNSSCGITVTLTPSVAGAETGALTISDALRSQTVKLSGTGLAPPLISLSATTLAFGSQQINIPATAKTLTITNRGGAPLAQPSFSISGTGATSFGVGTTTCGATVAANASCTVQVIFTPATVGAVTATFTVGTSSPGVKSASTALTGTGLAPPILGVSPANVNFGTVDVGFSSNTYTVQVTNIGQVAMAQPTFTVGGLSGPSGAQLGDFTLSTPTDLPVCTAGLNPGASCYIQATFSPSVVGTESATLVVTASNAVPPTATVSLTGVGAPAITLQASVANLSFPSTTAGTTSAPLTLSLSNLGRQTANGLAMALSGPYSLNSTLTTCTGTLKASSSCTVGLVFAPTASGDQPGSLIASVTNIGVPPLTIPLDGSGIAVGGFATQPTQMTFGSLLVGSTSPTQTLTVTNSGGAALAGLTISVTGNFGLTANLCPATLAAGASCTTGVTFTPTTTGIQAGTITLSSTSTGVTPAVVPLTGNGIPAGSITANPGVVSFGTVTVGQSGPAQMVTLNNTGTTSFSGLQYQVTGDFGMPQNGCGTSLTGGASCTFAVSFSPSQAGTRIGAVTITSTAAGFTPLVVGLTGTGLPAAQLAVTPSQLNFGTVAVGANSAAMQLTISNPGTGTLQGLSETASWPFAVGSGNCGTSLAAGSTCVIPVTFSPAAAGNVNGTVTVASSSLGVPVVQVAVTGSGVLPASLSFSPATISFPGTAVGATSAGQTVTVTNPGGQGLAGLTLGITGAEFGDFALGSSNCTATLTAGASCSALVTFTPTVAGGRQAFVTASSTTAGVTFASATLNGTGLTAPVLSFTPVQVSFAPTLTGQVSATQTVTLTNSGQAGIADLQISASPGFGVDPKQTTCTAVLGGGASCTAGVLFAPAVAGAATGALTAISKASGVSATAALSGTGSLPPGIVTSPAAVIQFGTTGVGTAAPEIPVTISNPGLLSAVTGLTLTLNPAAVQNGYGLSGNTCDTTLAAGASCTVNVTFAPASYGPLTGTLSISSNNGTGPVTLQLVGIGFSFAFAISGNNTGTVTQGQTAYYTLALTTLGGSTGSSGGKFSLACTNLPANALCLFNPPQLSVLPANVTGDVSLGISTGAPTVAQTKMTHRGMVLLVCGVLALPFGWRRRSTKLRLWLWLAIFAGLAGVTSCAGSGGGSTTGQQHTGGGTPTGSYQVSVTASANGISQTLKVTLVVD